jgi:inorganic pyrophosphatase
MEIKEMIERNNRNPWHYIDIGDKAPQILKCIIEIPKGSKAKYELDKETGYLKLDRVLFSAVHYPANYGFIPKTYCDDKDPLDILVISSIDLVPLCIVDAKVIGVMRMLDEGQHDDKIIAVANNDMSVNYIDDINELPPHTVVELRRFFEDYKKLENKHVVVNHLLGKEKAFEIVNDSISLYSEVILR